MKLKSDECRPPHGGVSMAFDCGSGENELHPIQMAMRKCYARNNGNQ